MCTTCCATGWATAGDIVEFRGEFRGLNMKGDTLTCHGEVTAVDDALVALSVGVTNQDGTETIAVDRDGRPL